MCREQTPIATVLLVLAASAVTLAQLPPPAPNPLAINPAQAHSAQGAETRLDGPGFAIAYSDDTGLLVAACEDGSLHYWEKDVALGVRGAEAAAHVVKAHRGPATAVVAARGLTASAGTDGKILLWDLAAEKIVHTLDAGTVVRSLAASPAGKLLASAGDNAVVQLWDPATGKPGLKLAGAKDWLLAVAVSPDGKTVAAGGFDGKLYLWDTASGKSAAEVLAHAPPPPNTPAPAVNVVSAVAFSPDGKVVAVGASDTGIYLFQTADRKFVRSMAPAPRRTPVPSRPWRFIRPNRSWSRRARTARCGCGTQMTASYTRRWMGTLPGCRAWRFCQKLPGWRRCRRTIACGCGI